MESSNNKGNFEATSQLKNKTHVIELEDIKIFLEEAGINNYEPEVVTHLNDYINDYLVTILNCATTFMKHAGRDNVNISDVKLAIGIVQTKSPAKRLSLKDLIEIANKQNKEKLPEYNSVGILLPKNDCSLSKCNYILKKSSDAQFPAGSPLLDASNRQTFTFNSTKNNSGSIPIGRHASSVAVNLALNLAPQRIILKQPTFASINKMDENMNKRFKLEEI